MSTPMDQGRTPVSCPVVTEEISRARERMLDKTIADSFPASDPPSTDPAPEFDSFTP